MAQLWTVFSASFANKFTQYYGETPDPFGEWAETLKGVTDEQILNGIEKIRLSGRAWPPAAPEFREICTTMPLPKGMTTLELAWSEMQKYLKISPFRRATLDLSPSVRHTINRHLDWYNFKLLPSSESFKAFKIAYEATIQDVKKGRQLDKPSNAPQLEKIPLPKVDDVHRERCDENRKKVLSIFDD